MTEDETPDTFRNNPRDYAIELVELGIVGPDDMLLACLKFMSQDDVRHMLEANELSPRFIDDMVE